MEYNQQKLSLIRRYPLETLVAFMLLGMGGLAKWVVEIQKDVNINASKLESYLKTDNSAMIKIIENNNYILGRVADKLEKSEAHDLH